MQQDAFWLWLGLLIPFAGTALGAASVFLVRGELSPKVQKFLLGFASGVMVAAAVWSLLIPAMEMSEPMGRLAFVPAATGVAAGMLFLWGMDRLIPHLHLGSDAPEGLHSTWSRRTMLVVAVTLHNLPEGMAVGIVFAGALAGDMAVGFVSAMALAIGIAVQNFPEGAVISLPLHAEGASRRKAFGLGVLSGVVEPAGALLTIALSAYIMPALPYLLAFAAGAMLYVVVEELVPESATGEHSNKGTAGFGLGFVLMMILDVALG